MTTLVSSGEGTGGKWVAAGKVPVITDAWSKLVANRQAQQQRAEQERERDRQVANAQEAAKREQEAAEARQALTEELKREANTFRPRMYEGLELYCGLLNTMAIIVGAVGALSCLAEIFMAFSAVKTASQIDADPVYAGVLGGLVVVATIAVTVGIVLGLRVVAELLKLAIDVQDNTQRAAWYASRRG